jgi:drug/metabolite transporter (DMT)-like permease
MRGVGVVVLNALAGMLPGDNPLVAGVVLLVGAVALAWVGRAAVAAVNDREEPIATANMWVGALAGGVASVVGMALASGADVLVMLAELVAGNPVAVSNFGVAALGAAAIEGLLSMSGQQYLGIAMAIVGAVLVVREGYDLA